jgi:hypothetical protein
MYTTSKLLQLIDTFLSLPTFAPSIIIIILELLVPQHLDSISIYAALRLDLFLLETNQLRHFFLAIISVYISTFKHIVSLSRHPLTARILSRRTPSTKSLYRHTCTNILSHHPIPHKSTSISGVFATISLSHTSFFHQHGIDKSRIKRAAPNDPPAFKHTL